MHLSYSLASTPSACVACALFSARASSGTFAGRQSIVKDLFSSLLVLHLTCSLFVDYISVKEGYSREVRCPLCYVKVCTFRQSSGHIEYCSVLFCCIFLLTHFEKCTLTLRYGYSPRDMYTHLEILFTYFEICVPTFRYMYSPLDMYTHIVNCIF